MGGATSPDQAFGELLMKINSRTKGHSFEREIVRDLRDELGTIIDQPIKRILDQYREHELPDIFVPPFAIECKRYAKGYTYRTEWWDQVTLASEKAGLIPALIYRYDRQQIQCVVPLYAINPEYPRTNEVKATVDWPDFVLIVRENILASP